MATQSRLLFIGIVALTLAAVFYPRGDGTSAAPGGFLLDASGRPTTLGNHMTPITLLHFWATWCPPCITEIPALDRLATDFGDVPGFQISMVAVQDELEKVRPFVGQRAFGVLYDPTWDVAHRYGTRKLPETYLVINGRVVRRFVGAQNWDDPEIRGLLKKAVDAVMAGEEIPKEVIG